MIMQNMFLKDKEIIWSVAKVIIVGYSEVRHFLRKEHRTYYRFWWFTILIWRLLLLPIFAFIVWSSNMFYRFSKYIFRESIPGDNYKRDSIIDTVLFKTFPMWYLHQNVGLHGPVFSTLFDWKGSLVFSERFVFVCVTPEETLVDQSCLVVLDRYGSLSSSPTTQLLVQELSQQLFFNIDLMILLEKEIPQLTRSFFQQLHMENNTFDDYLFGFGGNIFFRLFFCDKFEPKPIPDSLRQAIQIYADSCFQHHDEMVLRARQEIVQAIRATIMSHCSSNESQITTYISRHLQEDISSPLVCIAWQELHRSLLEKQNMGENINWRLTEESKMEVMLAFVVEHCYLHLIHILKYFAKFTQDPNRSQTIQKLRTENISFRRKQWQQYQHSNNDMKYSAGDSSNEKNYCFDGQFDWKEFMRMYDQPDQAQPLKKEMFSNAPQLLNDGQKESWLHLNWRKLIQYFHVSFGRFGAIFSGGNETKDLVGNQEGKEDDVDEVEISFLCGPHFEENADNASSTAAITDKPSLELDICNGKSGKDTIENASSRVNSSSTDVADYHIQSFPHQNQSNDSSTSIHWQTSNQSNTLPSLVDSSTSSTVPQFFTSESYFKLLSTIVGKIILESSNTFNKEMHLSLSFVLCRCISPCPIICRRRKLSTLPVGQHVLLVYDPDKLPHHAISNTLGLFSELFLSILLHEWASLNPKEV